MPQRQTVFPARDRNKNPVVFPKHLLRLDRARDLVMHKTVETAFAECGMVSGDLDDRFGFALGAVHGPIIRAVSG